MSVEYDIVIVGGGMVGAALAAKLASQEATSGLRIALVEAGPQPPLFTGDNFDPRVVALSQKSAALLQSLGVWQDIMQVRACAYTAMDIWDAEGTGNIQFYAEDVHQPCLGHIIENSTVVRCLRNRLESLPSVTLLDGYRVVGFDNSTLPGKLTLQGTDNLQGTDKECTRELHASLVVAADGARSQMREMVGLKTREWDYHHTAIVTTVRCERSHQFTCWQRFTQRGPIALLPLQPSASASASADTGSRHFCSLVWSAQSDLAEELMALDTPAFCHRLGQAFEYRLGAVEQTAERFAIPLRQRHAVDYIGSGFALVGDAAHSIHPLAGQGVNLGFYDVQALAEEVSRACQRNIPLVDGSILRRYQRNRKTQNLLAMASMESFKQLFAADDPFVRWARNSGMSLVNNQFFLKKQLAQIAAG